MNTGSIADGVAAIQIIHQKREQEDQLRHEARTILAEALAQHPDFRRGVLDARSHLYTEVAQLKERLWSHTVTPMAIQGFWSKQFNRASTGTEEQASTARRFALSQLRSAMTHAIDHYLPDNKDGLLTLARSCPQVLPDSPSETYAMVRCLKPDDFAELGFRAYIDAFGKTCSQLSLEDQQTPPSVPVLHASIETEFQNSLKSVDPVETGLAVSAFRQYSGHAARLLDCVRQAPRLPSSNAPSP